MRRIVLGVAVCAAVQAGAGVGAASASSTGSSSAPGGSGVEPGSEEVPVGPGVLTYYIDRGSFESAYPMLATEAFENGSTGPGQIAVCPTPLDATSDNACFSPGQILPGLALVAPCDPACGDPGIAFVVVGAGYAGVLSDVPVSNWFVDSLVLEFDPPVRAVGFDAISVPAPTSCVVEVFDAASGLLGETATDCTAAGVFLGIGSPVGIGRVRIHAPAETSEGADNLSFIPLVYENDFESGLVCDFSAAPTPPVELCDGLDNDCDLSVDEGNPEGGGDCNTGLPGICMAGTLLCLPPSGAEPRLLGGNLICSVGFTPGEVDEVCDDKLDNDCDGFTDCDDPDCGPNFSEGETDPEGCPCCT